MKEKIIEILKSGLKRNIPIPLYYQIEKTIKELILDGKIKEMDFLPGDLELSKQLGVNSRTVWRAYQNLQKEGYIKRIPRKGTFVIYKRNKISHSIGFFYFSEAEEVMVKRAEYMQRFLSQYGYDLKIFPFDYNFYKEVNLPKFIEEKDLKGGIFVALDYVECRDNFLRLEEIKFPHVRLGNMYFLEELKYPLICGNEGKKVKDVLNYLNKLGHKKIGYVSSKEKGAGVEEYFKFYEKRDFKQNWFLNLNFSGSKKDYKKLPTSHIARGYLETNIDLTAIIVEYPLFAIDLIEECKKIGIKVPEDISIIALRDTEEILYYSPSITTMKLSDKKQAEKACEILLKVMNNEWDFKRKIIMVNYELVERETSTKKEKLLEKEGVEA
ncbi:MAG: GntR family transcriptional regulator [Candidatus Omnitrophica bacterium]|nr:GntR family transcriptional regulator [Candidatus Omnitrophota bacterium]